MLACCPGPHPQDQCQPHRGGHGAAWLRAGGSGERVTPLPAGWLNSCSSLPATERRRSARPPASLVPGRPPRARLSHLSPHPCHPDSSTALALWCLLRGSRGRYPKNQLFKEEVKQNRGETEPITQRKWAGHLQGFPLLAFSVVNTLLCNQESKCKTVCPRPVQHCPACGVQAASPA